MLISGKLTGSNGKTLRKSSADSVSLPIPMKPLNFTRKLPGNVQIAGPDIAQDVVVRPDIDLDQREVYFFDGPLTFLLNTSFFLEDIMLGTRVA